jgi:ABC-type transport system involved in multi-copper enzyme maturation permease subunit
MIALVLYSINSIYRNVWKKGLIFSVMFIEGIFVYYGADTYSATTLLPTPKYSLLFIILITCSGIINMDYTKGYLDVLFGKPISKINYLLGKYIGVLLVIIVWDILNFFYLNIISFIFQSKTLSIVYIGENILIHLLDIIAISVFMIFISTMVAKGIDIMVFFFIMIIGDMIKINNLFLPDWIGKYFLSFRFSDNLFNMTNNIDNNLILFIVGTSTMILLPSILAFFIFKHKVEY